MKERLQKILSAAGIASRRKAEELIRAGHVTVNGRVAKVGDQADAAKDRISVVGKRIRPEDKAYYLFHKPAGYITSRPGPNITKTIFSLVRVPERVFPVGRLDVASEGLLILTNDGDFAQQVTHPSHEIAKTYRVDLDKPLDPIAREKIQRGLTLEDDRGKSYRTQDIQLSFPTRDHHKVDIVVHQGKNRMVRRIFEKFGYTVRRLVRTKIGTVALGNLPSGQLRRLTKDEIRSISKSAATQSTKQ